jgi:hypothetical protein
MFGGYNTSERTEGKREKLSRITRIRVRGQTEQKGEETG